MRHKENVIEYNVAFLLVVMNYLFTAVAKTTTTLLNKQKITNTKSMTAVDGCSNHETTVGTRKKKAMDENTVSSGKKKGVAKSLVSCTLTDEEAVVESCQLNSSQTSNTR